ncbi:hypothetical protein IW140_000197 [Coemansia sp. RSA 1813]|nr:hypothetical protein EV178_000401 [Coemansia sp. RSA 1646]KAJ1773828.1 hypothetical protein LPJ74_000372 [Coemansia sp. RSA 1843]KAJ2093792.1 hypothetical protein IW138_000188 [Coemansia sp. RSA 986]KAJ2218002.1 hypothetical protein EV179_000147 [Coemansia sp. RSA 487]KAJ2573154.1 hypothetical protein IW140_000197 [Coemansia sp. RSA 1813]
MGFSKYFKINSSKTSFVDSVYLDRKASIQTSSTYSSVGSSASTKAETKQSDSDKIIDASKGGNPMDAFNYLFNANTNSPIKGAGQSYPSI